MTYSNTEIYQQHRDALVKFHAYMRERGVLGIDRIKPTVTEEENHEDFYELRSSGTFLFSRIKTPFDDYDIVAEFRLITSTKGEFYSEWIGWSDDGSTPITNSGWTGTAKGEQFKHLTTSVKIHFKDNRETLEGVNTGAVNSYYESVHGVYNKGQGWYMSVPKSNERD